MLDALFEDRRIRHATLRIAKPEVLDGATPSVTVRRENPRAERLTTHTAFVGIGTNLGDRAAMMVVRAQSIA